MAKLDDTGLPQEEQALLRCRFYKNEFPEKDELVIVNVTEIADLGVYVTLDEYDHMEGMINRTELSRRRIRSINKLVRVGRQEWAVVTRIDKEKGYIDLSKSQVHANDVPAAEERYNKAKKVHNVMRHVAKEKGWTLERAYEVVGWPLYDAYMHAYEAFKVSMSEEPEDIYAKAGIAVDEETKLMISSYCLRTLAPKTVKIRATIEVTCFTYEGIDAIKTALAAGVARGTADIPIAIKLIAPPTYVMTTTALDKDLGIATLKAAIDAIKVSIESFGGKSDTKGKGPEVVKDADDDKLAKELERLAEEQKEVDGDAPEDEDD